MNIRALCLVAVLVPQFVCAAEVSVPRGHGPEISGLFQRLVRTADPGEAATIQTEIQELWSQSPSDTANLLYARGLEARANNGALALELLTAVTELQPDFADAWNALGRVNFALGAPETAVLDLERALTLEPRHFDAMLALAAIFEFKGNRRAMLDELRRAYRVNPHIPGIAAKIRALALEVEGRRI